MHKMCVCMRISISLSLYPSLTLCMRVTVFVFVQCKELLFFHFFNAMNVLQKKNIFKLTEKGEKKKPIAQQKFPITMQIEWTKHSHQVVFSSFIFSMANLVYSFRSFFPRLYCGQCDRTTTTHTHNNNNKIT